METDHLYCIFKHYRFLGSGGVNLRETETYTGRHGRAYHWQRGQTKDWQPSERGGYTLCYLKVKDEVVAVGLAECSKLDHFCYRMGRQIAQGRAVKALSQKQFDEQVLNWAKHYAEEVA